MSEHGASLRWERGDGEFVRQRYSRVHAWQFDGGAAVRASASPLVVRPPFSDPAGVDPEEAFVASLASCHLLWFLSLASDAGFVVDRYEDEASGTLAKNAEKKLAITQVVLRPRVIFSGDRRPSPDEISELHHQAHERCFIANSVRTEISIEPR
jgi:organic hydroperoxide reductase OsmC/OhrA